MLPAEVKRRRFTVREYHSMAEAGLLSEDDRVELVDGEIVEMAPVGTRHLACVVTLTHFLTEASGDRYSVSVQNPIVLDEGTEFQPDLSLLRAKPDPAGNLPATGDLLLVVEVSDTTLAYDREVKLPRYGQSGIPEVWIVDLVSRRVETYSGPCSEGYRSSHTFGASEQVRSISVEDLELPAREMFS
ncbi:Uma2 family endonuclease [soil metagenome]